jgi:hypothetical protein
MASPSSLSRAVLLDLPLEVLANVCQHLDPPDLVRVAETCKRFRHGDAGLDTVELPNKLPVVAALCEHAFPRLELIQITRPAGCSESWAAFLARCVRQRRCREALPIAVSDSHSLFVDSAGRLLACGRGTATGQGNEYSQHADLVTPTPVAAMAAVRVRSVASGCGHSLAFGWDGRVNSWGNNSYGQLGHGDNLSRPLPAPVDGLEGVCSIAAAVFDGLAVTQSGGVFQWGSLL